MRALASNGSQIIDDIEDKAEEVTDMAEATLQAAQNTIRAMMSDAVAPLNAQISTTRSSAVAVNAALDASRSTIVAFRSSVGASIEDETNALQSYQVDASLSIATHRLNLQLGLTDDVVERVGLNSDKNAFFASAAKQIEAAVNTFINGEVSRGVVESSSLNTAWNSFNTASAANISTSVSNEVRRVTGTISTAVRAIVARPVNASGLLDNTNWCVSVRVPFTHFAAPRRRQVASTSPGPAACGTCAVCAVRFSSSLTFFRRPVVLVPLPQ